MPTNQIPDADLTLAVAAGHRWNETRHLVNEMISEYRHLDANGIYEVLRELGHQVDRDEVRAAFEAA